jgi:hypothetical protein
MKTLRSLAIGALMVASLTLSSRAQVQVAGSLYVDIDPSGASLGPLQSITNLGTEGGVFEASSYTNGTFTNSDWPVVVATGGGTKGIMFNGRSQLEHDVAPGGLPQVINPSLTGLNPTYSIEVWANNPSVDNEEQMVSWGRTGGGGTNALMAFSYGAGGNAAGGAVNRSTGSTLVAPYNNLAGPNVSWGNIHPRPGTWHHLVYTFDGANRMNRLYVDGTKVVQCSNLVDVNTWGFTNISIANSRSGGGGGGNGSYPGQNTATRAAMIIGHVRIHSGVLSDANVLNNYLFEVNSFSNNPAFLSSGPIHRYSFNIPTTADAVGLTITDSVGTAHGLVQGFAGNWASTDGNKLRLLGGPPTAALTPAYVDFPNGLLSTNAATNGGTGQITIEGWATTDAGYIWSPMLNFGTTTTGERTGPDVSTTGYQGRNYLNWSLNGTSKSNMRFEIGVASTNDIPTNFLPQPGVTFTADYLNDNKNKVPYAMKYFAITWNEASGDVTIYINGVEAHHFNTLPWKFHNIGDVNVWLGRSPWQGDNYMGGTWDEYRIYDRVLSASEVASDYHWGPDVVATSAGDVGALSSIALQLGNTNTWVGTAPQLTALANYANVSGVDITDTPGIDFSSSDTAKATVSSNGLVQLLNTGAVTFTATFGGMTNTLTITNVAPPTPSVIHRYSFTGAFDYTDSIAGADGTANGTAISDGTGKLLLDPTGQGYLSLPTTVLDGVEALSLEAWVNVNTAANNSQLWAFGDQNATTGSGRYGLFLTTSPNVRTALFDTDAGAAHEQSTQRNGNLNGRVNQHIVGVYDPLLGKIQVYLNGAISGQVGCFTPLTSTISNVLYQLGRSLYTADPYWNGSVDEFRIWHGALNQQQVAVNDAAGPNSVVTSPGSLLSVASSLPIPAPVVTVNQQAVFTGTFSGIGGVNLFTYGEGAVTCTSDNTNVVTVNSSGFVNAVGIGSANLVFSFGGFSFTNAVTVGDPSTVLKHRYNFNGDYVDSVGGANGSPQGGATLSGGKVVLNSATSDHVMLPSGILYDGATPYFALTVEFWADFGSNISGSWLYGFGDQNGQVQGRFYSYFSPHINNSSRAGITANDPGNTGEQNVTDTLGNLDNLTNVHVAIVQQPFLGNESLYINGVRRAINTNVTTLLSAVSSNLAWIGRSLYDSGGIGGYPTNQPYLNASIDEFRIYVGGLTNSQIALDAASGPNVIITNPGAINAASVRLIVNSNMTFGTDQLVQYLADFANVSNVNLFGYTNTVTLAVSDTNVLTTNNLQGSIRGNGTGQATLTATLPGIRTNTAVISVVPANGPYIALRHRYTFNVDASDSVGGAHGTLMGAAVISNNAVQLPGGANNNASAYVDLPDGVISSLSNATFEVWARKDANVGWQRIFDFGSSDSTNTAQFAGAGVTYIFLTTDVGATPSVRFAYTTNSNGAESPVLNGAIIATGVTNHYVITFDTNNNTSVLYLNGAVQATGPALASRPLSGLVDTNNWLGRSQWSGDGNFQGNISEFRIYEGVLSAREIAASSAAGPDANPPIPPVLNVVSNLAGQVTLTWPSFALRYGLQGSADLSPGSWTNVTPFAPVTAGNIRRVTVPTSGAAHYFRLTD